MDSNLVPESDRPRRLVTTRWSLILAAGGAGAHPALDQLCQIYWRPIFAFICRRGYAPTDAEDLTQDFFVMVMEGDLLRHADPERGRFRSLLLKSLQHFLSKAREKGYAQKRGGRVRFVSWDDWIAEAPSQLNLSQQAFDTSTPERLFDIRWAATLVEQAMARLAEECASRGRRRAFEALRDYLFTERAEMSYAELATRLGMAEEAVKRLLHQFRIRYRALLREEVTRTVETEAEVEDEIRYLCAVLAADEEEKPARAD